jgi:uncharacterized small protein (DUF1192 family)
MDLEDLAPKKKPDMVIGEDLAAISIAELEHRIQLLEAEIARIGESIRSKQASKAAADAFFQR